MKGPKQPMQPMAMAGNVLRFQCNAIVEFIVAEMCEKRSLPSYNDLMAMPWSDSDRDQFNELNGYSVSGCPYRDERRQGLADRRARRFIAKLEATR